MQRFKGIAALLMVFLLLPLRPACAAMARGMAIRQVCCEPHHADDCCNKAASPCGAAQLPIGTTPLQDVSAAFPPATLIAVEVFSADRFDVACAGLPAPMRHAPPGLLIARTIILRI